LQHHLLQSCYILWKFYVRSFGLDHRKGRTLNIVIHNYGDATSCQAEMFWKSHKKEQES